MRKMLLIIVSASMVFAGNTLSITEVSDDGAGNVTFTLGYSFDDVVAGFQFDFLSDAMFTLTGAEGGASGDAGMMVSTNESGTVIGFSMTGATIAAGSGTFLTLSGTYDTANNGMLANMGAYDSCNDDGDPACGDDDTRMVLSDSNASALESNFVGVNWTIGSNTLNNDSPEIYSYGLSANYPNPFNPSTTISYSIASPGEVSIVVYDMMGRHVRTLVSDFATPGSYDVIWDAKNDQGSSVAAGMYLYEMVSGDFVEVNKMLLVK